MKKGSVFASNLNLSKLVGIISRFPSKSTHKIQLHIVLWALVFFAGCIRSSLHRQAERTMYVLDQNASILSSISEHVCKCNKGRIADLALITGSDSAPSDC